MNFASPKVTRIRSEGNTQFATFRFDLCGPCYLRPLRRMKPGGVDPGFLVADVVLGTKLDEEGISPFIRKCELLSHLKGVRPFLPMLIADGFTLEALQLCRSNGIIATRPDTLFGQDVARALTDLLEVLNHAANVAATQPDRLEKLFDRLSSIEGAAGNLRGALFELIAGHLVKQLEGGSIDIGCYVNDPKTMERREIDIRHVKQLEVGIYECKGHQPTKVVRGNEIKDWLENKVPIIYSAHKSESRFNEAKFCFNFWTCGRFDTDAQKLLQEASKRTKKYQISWKDGNGIRDVARKIQAPGIRNILDQHYFNHPLRKLA